MRKFLMLILCLFLASTLVVSISCEKKEEAPPAPTEEVAPPAEAPPAEEGVLGEGFGPKPPPEDVLSEGMAPPAEEHH